MSIPKLFSLALFLSLHEGSEALKVNMRTEVGVNGPKRSVYEIWDKYDGDEIIDKSPQYAKVYDKYMNEVVSDTPELRMLEIGVQSGGSAMAWKQYGVDYFVGLDIDPRCKRFESDADKRYIEIGSQSNETFLKELCKKHGPFDVVIDDGGHRANLINTSVRAIFPDDSCMKKDSVYFIEDLHVMYRCDEGYCQKPSDVYEFIDPMFYAMHHHWTKPTYGRSGKLHQKYKEDPQKPVEKQWLEKIKSINLHESMIVLVRGQPEHVKFQRKGRVGFNDGGVEYGGTQ